MQQCVGVFTHCVLRNTWPHFCIMQYCWFALLREFTERQKAKREEIVAKILQEEQLVKSRKKHRALLSSNTNRLLSLRRVRETFMYYLDPSPPSTSEEKLIVSGPFQHLEFHLGNECTNKPSLFETTLIQFPPVKRVQWHQQFIISFLWWWWAGRCCAPGRGPPEPHWMPGWAWVLWAMGHGLQGTKNVSHCQLKANPCKLLKLNTLKSCSIHSKSLLQGCAYTGRASFPTYEFPTCRLKPDINPICSWCEVVS